MIIIDDMEFTNYCVHITSLIRVSNKLNNEAMIRIMMVITLWILTLEIIMIKNMNNNNDNVKHLY